MSTEWYFIRDGMRVGPRGQDEVETLFSTGVLPASTLVWRAGMENWRAAGDTPELMHAVPAAGSPPAVPAELQPRTVDAGPAAMVGAREAPVADWHPGPSGFAYDEPAPQPVAAAPAAVHPWRRWTARVLDVVFGGFLLGGAVEVVSPGTLLQMNDNVASLLVLAVWVPMEALVLALFGTTAGKRLLRIHVTRADGSRLDFGTALERSFKVWLMGLGLGLPLVSLVTQVFSFNRLMREGRTSWDQSLDLRVTHQELSTARWMVVAGMIVLLVALIAIGSMPAESP